MNILKKYDKIRIAVKWGLIWGPLQGFWFLAPHFLMSHILYPGSLAEWLLISLFFLLVFGSMGIICAIFATYFFLVYMAIFKKRSDPSSIAHGTAIGMLMPVIYLLLGYLFLWMKLGTLLPLNSALNLLDLVAVAGIVAAVAVYSVLVKLQLSRRRFYVDPVLLGCIIIGATFVPFRIADPRITNVEVELPQRKMSEAAVSARSAPLLFIGMDGVNWRSLNRALHKNSVPTIERLILEGSRGTVQGLWPPYWSGPAWASILTGFPRENTGIYEDLKVTTRLLKTPIQLPFTVDIKIVPLLVVQHYLVQLGLMEVSPLSRPMLRQKPVWELLSQALPESSIAVIRFWFTHPPDSAGNIIMVSDWVGVDAWFPMNVSTRTNRPTVTPSHLSHRLLQFYSQTNRYKVQDFVDEQNYRRPQDTFVDPLAVLYASLQIDGNTLDAGDYLVEETRDLDLLMVYLGGFDMIAHAFWQYSFPEDFLAHPPENDDVDRLGPVMDRYLQFLDRRLAKLISAFPRRPNVLIVSDHGHEADHSPLVWRTKHAAEGIFIASGPDVWPSKEELTVSYFDIVPTILGMFGLEIPNHFPGLSLISKRSDQAKNEEKREVIPGNR